MKNKNFLGFVVFLCSMPLLAQVGIGVTSPDNSAMLEVKSTVAGVLIPRMTQAQRTAIASPGTGLLIYQIDSTTGFWYYNGSAWTTFSSAGWSLTGDAGTTPATNFLGTVDNQDFILATNNTERIRFQTDGDVGINQSNPTTKLHITGSNPVFRLQDGTQAANRLLTSDAYGNVSWKTNSNLTAPDDDWRFISGNTYADRVYHTGKVVIGRTGTTTHHMDIDNGANTGTTFAIGDNEYLRDGNNETQFSHSFVPRLNNTYSLGSSTFKWRTLYATNGSLQVSDGREKVKITPLSYGINTIKKLNPVSYKWKEEKYLNYEIPENKKETKLGFLAQELQQSIPEVVYSHTWRPKSEKEHDTYVKVNNDYLGVNYDEILAVLVKAKQEQQLEIEKLQEETQALLNRAKQQKNK